MEAAELERLAQGVAAREQALAQREEELETRAKTLKKTQLHADELLDELTARARELAEHQHDLDERERLLEEEEREMSRADEAAVVGKALISAQRAADLLQAEAAQEAETTITAAQIEAKAIVARAQHTREMADRERAQVNELLAELRAALGETISKWNSLAPYTLDGDEHEHADEDGDWGRRRSRRTPSRIPSKRISMATFTFEPAAVTPTHQTSLHPRPRVGRLPSQARAQHLLGGILCKETPPRSGNADRHRNH